MIILKENEWAGGMIAAKSLGKKPYETLCRVARYYFDLGYKKAQVRDMLCDYLLSCDPKLSIPKWDSAIDGAISYAAKRPAVDIDAIPISVQEMQKIAELDGRQLRRLAFTLLCLAKYQDAVNPKADHWVCAKDNEIMKMANIGTSMKRQGAMYHTLCEAGLISFSKRVDNTNVRVCFIDGEEAAMLVSDYRNLGYQYMMECGSQDYFRCMCCGNVVRKNHVRRTDGVNVGGRPQKYCNECAVKSETKRLVESVMRH